MINIIKTNSIYSINNINATKEEAYIGYYLNELKEEGGIEKIIFQPESFTLFEGLPKKFYKDKQLKTKVKRVYSKRQYLINPHIYTPDFKIIWKPNKYFNEWVLKEELDKTKPFIVHNHITAGVSYIEVKPSFDQNNMTRMFTSHIQPWIWQKYNIYVQLIKPLDLFKQTFIPKEILEDFYYKKSGRWGKKGTKKYKWEYKSCCE